LGTIPGQIRPNVESPARSASGSANGIVLLLPALTDVHISIGCTSGTGGGAPQPCFIHPGTDLEIHAPLFVPRFAVRRRIPALDATVEVISVHAVVFGILWRWRTEARVV
jgi:hypothetical protein